MKIRGTTINTPLARHAVPDDSEVSRKPWSSKNTVDKLCPSFTESGAIVTCEPVEDYPLQVKWSKKNLLNITAQSQTINGVTFTVNEDGSVTTNGTATANANFALSTMSLPVGDYVLSGCPAGGGYSTYSVFIQTGNNAIYDTTVVGKTFSSDDGTVSRKVLINIQKGQTVSDLTFYPMIRPAGTSDAYEPYVEAPTAITRCGKNLIPYIGTTTTSKGITFTGNDDGSITVDGTATGDVFFNLGKIPLKTGYKYHVSGCPSGGSWTTHRIYLSNRSFPNSGFLYEFGNGNTFTAEVDGTATAYIGITAGITMTNAVFYPMVRLDGTDDTFGKFKGDTFTPGDTIPALDGVNTIYADAGLVTVKGRANPATIIEKLINAIISLGGNV